jgi:hypothetical protein
MLSLPLLSLAFFFFMCGGFDGVEQLPVPSLDLLLMLSARLSHRRRISSMFSFVGRRRFPQFFVQPAGRSPMADQRPAPGYRILCMYARALTYRVLNHDLQL